MRRGRPSTNRFSPIILAIKWDLLANKRDCGFQWDGSDYDNIKRNLSIDQAGLCNHGKALGPLLDLAPSGFPSHGCVRATLMELQIRYSLFCTDKKDVTLWPKLNTAADMWRIMCKDVYLLAYKPPRVAGSSSGQFGCQYHPPQVWLWQG